MIDYLKVVCECEREREKLCEKNKDEPKFRGGSSLGEK